MRDYGKISTTIWDSRKFGSVSDDARLLYLYLHTCKSVNSVGCFTLKQGYALADLGWSEERYRKGMDTLCKAYLIGFDEVENLVRIVDFLKFDPFTNPKHAMAGVKIANGLPECEEKFNLFRDIADSKHVKNPEDLAYPIETLSKPYRNPEPEPEPEPEEEPNGSLSSGDDEQDSDPEPIDEISQAVEAYRRVAEQRGWPDIRILSKARRSALSARLREAGGISGWEAALEKAESSSFCNGQNDSGWVVTFDFLTKQSSFAKLMEGNYDDRPSKDRPSQISGGSGQGASMASLVARREAQRAN